MRISWNVVTWPIERLRWLPSLMGVGVVSICAFSVEAQSDTPSAGYDEPHAIYSTEQDAAAAELALAEQAVERTPIIIDEQPEAVVQAVAEPFPTAPVEKKKKRGLLGRLFGFGKEKAKVELTLPEPEYVDHSSDAAVAEVSVVADSPAIGPRTAIELESQSDGLQRFPLIDLPHTRTARTETQINQIIDAVTSLYTERADGVNELEMGLNFDSLPDVPKGFNASWSDAIDRQIWSSEKLVNRGLFGVYASALENSHQVRAFSEVPLIRETGIQEAEGEFDIITVLDGRTSSIDRPTSTTLDTGNTGRFLEDRTEGEIGLRKKLASTGANVSIANRLGTLNNNSEFTIPNPQTTSEVIVSVTQPLLAGAGYHYNTTRIKVAKLDSKMAASEYVQQLEAFLLEVNRAYWGVYLARAGYLQKRSLVDRTESIVNQLQDRAAVDQSANLSELLRARSSLAQRKASLIRAAMAIRTSEERLRALVNDPEYRMGASGEFIPTTRPILGGPQENIREVALDAITNRPEVLQSVYQVKAAGLFRDQQKNDLLPTLNLILEGTASGLDANRDLGGAYTDIGRNDVGWLAGLQMQLPWERNFAKARYSRRQHELRQQQHVLRATIDNVLLEAIVAYQELRTSYRDMQGKYQAVLATREELQQLEDRLDVDTDDERTVGNQLQLILDSIERNERSEEDFLVSVVLYNVSFTSLDRARGTLLRQHGVEILRTNDGELDVIESQLGSRPADGGGKSGSGNSRQK